jgi:DNA invertase Pin-like site-specific DNA recombinase
MRAVLYLRLSASADDSTSIARQEADLRELAQREGWEVVRVLADDGISGRKVRANVAEAFRMLTAGEAAVLAVWKLDRLTRQGLGAVGELVSTLDAVPGSLFVAHRDGLRSDQPAWRIIAAVLSEVARTEAENTSARAKSAIAYRKTVTHRFTGGGTIPFGYSSAPAEDGPGRVLVVNEEEAAVVREVAERLLAEREPLSAIVADLTARGVPTSKSAHRRAAYRGAPTEGLDRGRWTASTVRALWTAPTIVGRVPLGDDVVRDADGLPVTVWPPLVELETLERLRARFGDRDPDRARPRRAARLLSGLAYCAHCGRKLYVTTAGGKPIYFCPANRNGQACRSPRIDAVLLEEFVIEDTLALDGAKPHREVIEVVYGEEAFGALREVEAALREATAAMMDDDADTSALLARVAALKERRSELRRVEPSSETIERASGLTIREHFLSLVDVPERRAELARHFDHLTVSSYDPAHRRGDVRARVRFMRESADAE